MANGTVQTGLIERVQIDNDTIQRIASTAYGVCSSLANEVNKTVQIDGFELITGVTVHIKFTYDNTATQPPTLNINGTGAINIVQYSNVAVGVVSETSGWETGAVLSLTYDGTYWVRDYGYNTNTTYSIVSTSAAGLVPQANSVNTQSQTTKFLREDGTWAIPSYTTNVDDATKQYIRSTDANYSLLFSEVVIGTADDTVSYPTYRNNKIYANPFTGTIYATAFNGSGADLSSLNASNLSSGTVNLNRLPTIPNSQLEYDSITIANHEFTLGDTITRANFLNLLGLSNSLHFIGVASHNQISEGSTIDPFDSSVPYSGANGDIVIDSSSLREYIWSNGEWLLLGLTLSTNYDSDNITATSNDTPTWISRITQTTDGLIQVERETLGIIEVAHGGTGVDNFTANQVILSGNTSTSPLLSRAYSDNTSATAFTNSSTNFVTERSIYYALPKINNVHNYDSDTEIFAPIEDGTTYQILVANDVTHTPEWAAAASIESHTSQIPNTAAYTSLILGNSANVSTSTSHSEGNIYLYSAATQAHIISGTSTTVEYLHTLPNADGIFVQIPSENAVGGPTQPVYVTANGTVTALTYTANRLYYSASTASFAATGHYATDTQIGINTTSLPNNNTDALYVNGTTTFNGNVHFNGVNNAVAHLNIATTNNSDNAEFIPDVTATGKIGTNQKQWYSGSFSNLLTIGDSTQGILMDYEGKLDIINGTSSIKLHTIDDSNNNIGVIEVKSSIPTIILETTSTISGGSGLENAWTIHNTNGNLTITNDGNTLIYANDYGIKIADRLYINDDIDNTSILDFYVDGISQLNNNVGIGIIPDASNLTDMHILSVNGSILISNSDTPTAHLDVAIDSNVSCLKFYPDAMLGDNNGYIGIETARWRYGYFSNILEVGNTINNALIGVQLDGTGIINITNDDSSIILDTTTSNLIEQSTITMQSSDATLALYTGNTDEVNITMTGAAPSITLDTLTNLALDWIIINDEGTFSINNQNLNLVSLDGNTLGFELTSRLYINNTIPNSQDYILYVGQGDTCFDGNAVPTLSNNVADKTLGLSGVRWAALYVGTADTYGDANLPVYWNNGVPEYTNGIVQKKSFSFDNNTTTTVIEDDAYNQLYGIETFVLQIVVEEGVEYLNSPIEWNSAQKTNSTTTGQITLSCTIATSGIVSGYIITARGIDLDPAIQSNT